MIRVNRRKVKIPKILKGKLNPGIQEKLDNIDFFEYRIGDAATFDVYSHAEVKIALIDLFSGKCAYCEREIMDVSFGNIEHFRPKGNITHDDGSKAGKGYYWLASDWYNLLLACSNCNTIHTDLIGNYQYGKGDYFPLMSGTTHSSRIQGIKREENIRLLINPTIDDPNDYLEFDVNTGAVRAKNTNLLVSERGQKTIEIFGLDKRVCFEKREEAIKIFWICIEKIKRAARMYDREPDGTENKGDLLNHLKEEITNLESLITNPKTENLGFLKLAMEEAKVRLDLIRPLIDNTLQP